MIKKSTPRRPIKMVGHAAISLHEYDDGTFNVHLVRMDRSSGRMVFDTLLEGTIDPDYPATRAELLQRGVDEYAAREGGRGTPGRLAARGARVAEQLELDLE